MAKPAPIPGWLENVPAAPGHEDKKEAHPFVYFGGGPSSAQIHDLDHSVPRNEEFLYFDEKTATYAPIVDAHGRVTHKLFYKLVGNGPKKIVFVMGLAADHTEWFCNALHFPRDEYTVCVFDNRGIWFSVDNGIPGGRWTTAAMAADANQLMDYLAQEDPGACKENWKARVHVIGASMGGMIAQEVVLGRPERVLSLTLCSTHAGGLRGTIPPLSLFSSFGKLLTSRNQVEMISNALPLKFPDHYLESEGVDDMYVGDKAVSFRDWVGIQLLVRQRKLLEARGLGGLNYSPVAVAKQVGAVMTHYVSYDRLRFLRESGIEFLVICGGLDRLVHSSNSKILHSVLGGEFMWKEDAAHCVNEQYADEFNEKLLHVIEKAEQKPPRKAPLAPPGPETNPLLLLLSLLAAYWISRRNFPKWNNTANIVAAALAGVIFKRLV